MNSRSLDAGMRDVLVLGGGNVGLATALMLQAQDLGVAVLDGRPYVPWEPPAGFDARVYAINPAAQSALDSHGAWQGLDPRRIGHIRAMHIHGDGGGQLHFGDGREVLAHVVEDGALQAALAATLHRQLGPRWHLHGEAEAVQITPEAAELRCRDGALLKARLLVGADGSQSWLRNTLGWPSHLHDYRQRGVVLNFASEQAHGDVARQWFSGGEVIALLPLGGQHVSLVWSAGEARAEQLLAGGPEACTRALAERIGTPLGALQPISTPRAFPLRLLRVPQICDHRVVLVGDAAHGVHPLAGQGLNLGLGDAAHLAHVLAGRGAGPDPGDRSVLRRHARQRAEAVLAMQTVTDGLHQLFTPEQAWLRGLRNAGLDLADRLPILKSLLSSGASGRGTSIAGSR